MAEQGLKAQIEAANRRFMDFFDSGDLQGLAECYTADAQFLVPGVEPLVGRAAIPAA
ncbi:MAG: nuclear transport factor 2 family protein, partial [Lysobacteraceae bacterium]